MLAYVSNSSEDFSSGGSFDIKKDALPRYHETLLYGKDYSAQPLSFDVEFVCEHDNPIPLDQMTEIKNWLFGQDGWKKFKLLDERQDYYLKCLFEPGDDIVDGDGYHGLRCTLTNASPFWYGEDLVFTFNHTELKATTTNAHPYWYTQSQMYDVRQYGIVKVELGDNNMVDIDYYPRIIIEDKRGTLSETYTSSTEFGVCISNCDATSIAEGATLDGIGFDLSDTSRIAFNTGYLGTVTSGGSTITSSSCDTITVSSRYGYVLSEYQPSHKFQFYRPNLPYLKLHKGVNIIRILEPTLYDSITLTVAPAYRLGAF
jgi:hypothetical protein